MTVMIKSQMKIGNAVVTMEAPYFDQLLEFGGDASGLGRLTRDLGCHACWYYFCIATKSFLDAKANYVYEDELSRRFNKQTAQQIFVSVANMYCIKPDQMVRFWDVIDRQRMALGIDDHLPGEFRFSYWGN